jgi:hypothetical protein
MYVIISIRSEDGILASNLAHSQTVFSDKKYKVLFRGFMKVKEAKDFAMNRFSLLIERNCKFYLASINGYQEGLLPYQNQYYFQLENHLPLYEEILALKNSSELEKSALIARKIMDVIQADNSIKTHFPCIEHGLLACQP